jgi:hypothetical protein
LLAVLLAWLLEYSIFANNNPQVEHCRVRLLGGSGSCSSCGSDYRWLRLRFRLRLRLRLRLWLRMWLRLWLRLRRNDLWTVYPPHLRHDPGGNVWWHANFY